MSKTVIITGANGQLGQYLISHLKRFTDYKVIGTVRHKSYNLQPIFHTPDEMAIMDLGDQCSINDVIKKYKPDFFINTAANAFVGESWSQPEIHMQDNCLGVLRQLEALKNIAPSCRYLNCGTSEEFGDVKYSPQDEKHPLSPRSPYGASKCAARHLVKVYRESYGMFAIQNWTFNFESSLRGEKYVTRKITKGVAGIKHAMEKDLSYSPIELGSFSSLRDWQHASDVASALWFSLNRDTPKEYVIGSGKQHSVLDFLKLSFDYLEIKAEFDKEKNVVFDMETKKPLAIISDKFKRPADVNSLLADSSEIIRDGWSGHTCSFESLVRVMVRHDYNSLISK